MVCNDGDIVEYPLDGVLDLHMFAPKDAASVLDEYLYECRKAGILHVRIIHGKGKGVLRKMVRDQLSDDSTVREYSTATDSSGWGATIAVLEPLAQNGTETER